MQLKIKIKKKTKKKKKKRIFSLSRKNNILIKKKCKTGSRSGKCTHQSEPKGQILTQRLDEWGVRYDGHQVYFSPIARRFASDVRLRRNKKEIRWVKGGLPWINLPIFDPTEIE